MFNLIDISTLVAGFGTFEMSNFSQHSQCGLFCEEEKKLYVHDLVTSLVMTSNHKAVISSYKCYTVNL